MYRRNLILRRFGALSFGLGYFDRGTWTAHMPGDGLIADAGPELEAAHAWLGCCSHSADPIAIRVSVGGDVRERIAVVARSASS